MGLCYPESQRTRELAGRRKDSLQFRIPTPARAGQRGALQVETHGWLPGCGASLPLRQSPSIRLFLIKSRGRGGGPGEGSPSLNKAFSPFSRSIQLSAILKSRQ
ncbi:hypothetical protein CapIbe_018250 [Capra ibex]